MAIRSRPIIGLRIGERLQAVPITQLINEASLTRPSAAWAWGSDQLLDEYAADELRRDYDPATGAFRGVLAEESQTNSVLNNTDFSQSSWSKLSVAVSEGAGSTPSGAQGVQRITAENTGSVVIHRARSSVFSVVAGESYSASVFLKEGSVTFGTLNFSANGFPGDTNTSFNLATGQVDQLGTDADDAYIDFVTPDGWAKCVLLATATSDSSAQEFDIGVSESSGDPNSSFDADGDEYILLWGASVEAEHASSFVETDGTATTRAADVLEGPFSESSGTLHFVGEHKGGDGVLWQADDDTEDSRMRFEVSGGDILFVVDDGGVNQVSLNAGALASDGTYSLAARFDGSDFAISLDGATAVNAASGTVPSVTTQRFGRDTSATDGINWYKTSTHRANKLTDSELEALTA